MIEFIKQTSFSRNDFYFIPLTTQIRTKANLFPLILAQIHLQFERLLRLSPVENQLLWRQRHVHCIPLLKGKRVVLYVVVWLAMGPAKRVRWNQVTTVTCFVVYFQGKITVEVVFCVVEQVFQPDSHSNPILQGCYFERNFLVLLPDSLIHQHEPRRGCWILPCFFVSGRQVDRCAACKDGYAL